MFTEFFFYFHRNLQFILSICISEQLFKLPVKMLLTHVVYYCAALVSVPHSVESRWLS